MDVIDPLNIADDLSRDKGLKALERLVSAMKKLEQIKRRGTLLHNKPAAFKQVHPKSQHIWEYKSSELRFYFYMDYKTDTLILIGYSTKDRQRDVIKQIVKKMPVIKYLLQQIYRKRPSNDSEQ